MYDRTVIYLYITTTNDSTILDLFDISGSNTTNDGTVVDLFDTYHVVRGVGSVALWRYCNLTFGIGLKDDAVILTSHIMTRQTWIHYIHTEYSSN
jgi:hypothetical protein